MEIKVYETLPDNIHLLHLCKVECTWNFAMTVKNVCQVAADF